MIPILDTDNRVIGGYAGDIPRRHGLIFDIDLATEEEISLVKDLPEEAMIERIPLRVVCLIFTDVVTWFLRLDGPTPEKIVSSDRVRLYDQKWFSPES